MQSYAIRALVAKGNALPHPSIISVHGVPVTISPFKHVDIYDAILEKAAKHIDRLIRTDPLATLIVLEGFLKLYDNGSMKVGVKPKSVKLHVEGRKPSPRKLIYRSCLCPQKDRAVHHRDWMIIEYKHTHFTSAIGYTSQPSKRSTIKCNRCEAVWRSEGKFVDQLAEIGKISQSPITD